MKKKFIALGLVMCLSLSLFVGCGGKKDEGSAAEGSTSAPTTAPTTPPAQEGDIKYEIPENIVTGMSPVIKGSVVNVSEEMCEKAILNMGNCQRLASVMERAAKGEAITIATIGGSITNGSSANPQDQKCFEALVREWWTNTFPDAKFTFVNAGVGATDSYLGVHRLQKDVLSKKPDLVVVEFSVNDAGTNNDEPYESLLRATLDSKTKPAVISLILTMKDNYNTEHAVIAKNLNIPIISYAKVVQDNLKEGIWKWSDLGASDGTHPVNEGHAVIAQFMTYYYSKVLASINSSSYTEYAFPKKTKTLCRYEKADIIYAGDLEVVESDGFELVNVSTNIATKKGYKTTSAGSITFKVKAKSIGMVYWATTDGKSGSFDVTINEEPPLTINADVSGEWGDYAKTIRFGNNKEEQEFTVKITPSAENAGTDLTILALTVAK